ncbi:MAG TPA: DEAD/DEAH box helicase family protein, partial [Candidatus Rifleibacterium sp.]|nr:DEAD/DEAH box helicase family protein [Candidatus Rifleibacterium sp.]
MAILEDGRKIENEIQELLVELKGVEEQRAKIISRIQLLQKSLTRNGFMARDNSVDLIEKTDNSSQPERKVSLFRSYFRGREDVFPRRFESQKTGKTGYQPVCKNEWSPGLCLKPAIKCGTCKNREFLPLTDLTIRNHLQGYDPAEHSGRDFTAGIYPLLADETCWFLAIDFDKNTWKEDATAFLSICEKHSVFYGFERSRSGNGGHIWIFFKEPVRASLARKLGTFLLSETMESYPGLGLDSYDRLFPCQDTLPKGGFGNLIALPLQKKPREKGNSVFINSAFEPYPDQWAFLSSIQKMSLNEVEFIVLEAERKNQILGISAVEDDNDELEPWKLLPSKIKTPAQITGVLPESIEIVLGSQLFVAKAKLSPALRNRIIRLAAFQNPEFYKAQAMRLPVFNKPRVINCSEEFPNHLALPKGCLDQLLELLNSLQIKPDIKDERNSGSAIVASFNGCLRPEQTKAAEALLSYDNGVLSASPAFGKTVIAAFIIAQRKTNVLILVHRQQLMEQWVTRLSNFLGISKSDIGKIGAGKRKISGMIDVAVIQSLSRNGVVDSLVENYGFIIVDECHHISARSFEIVLRYSPARYVLGLSATLTRKDGHHPIILMNCGPVRYKVSDKNQSLNHPFIHSVSVRRTAFQLPDTNITGEVSIQDMYGLLARDPARNAMIVEDIIAAVEKGKYPLVLTERTEHADLLYQMLQEKTSGVFLLKGRMKKKEKANVLEKIKEIPAEGRRVIIATGRFLGEGFDDERLDTLFLTMPISWKGTLVQYAGRLHRVYDSKKEVVVIDYLDHNIAV